MRESKEAEDDGDDWPEQRMDMEEEDGTADGGGMPSSSTAAAAQSSSTSGRPAIQHNWEDTAVSASWPLKPEARFHSLTHAEYVAQGFSRRDDPQYPHGIPIVIDNGAFELRAGFATEEEPRRQSKTAKLRRFWLVHARFTHLAPSLSLSQSPSVPSWVVPATGRTPISCSSGTSSSKVTSSRIRD